jgi:hypothetical protein
MHGPDGVKRSLGWAGLVARRGLWRGGERGETLAVLLAGFRRQAEPGPARGLGPAGVERGEDALIADGQQAGDPQGERGQARQPAPAAGDAGGCRVLDGGEGS